MKHTKLFLSLVILSFLFLSDLHAQDKLIGVWERTGDTWEGEQVQISKTSDGGYEGTLIKLPANVTDYCMITGNLKWRNIQPSSKGLYQMDDLISVKPDCAIKYDSRYINFTEDGKMSITPVFMDPAVGNNYQVWIKISDQ